MMKRKERLRRSFSVFLALMLVFSLMLIQGPVRAKAATSDWKFDFGNQGTASGFTGVNAATGYDSQRGYGFRNTSGVKDVTASGSNELSDAVQFTSTDKGNTFDVDLPNGLYEITVHLGNTNRTSVRVEDCLQIINMTGNNATATIKVPITDGQLNIMATEGKAGYAFTLSSLEIKKISDETVLPPTVWICGDSTVCNYYPLDTSTQAGWGQVLGQYIDTSKWYIENLAASGQYAKGFVDAGQFDAVLKYGKKGDIYIISIGINDTNYSNATEYYNTVTDMTKQAAAKGIKVVLVKQQGRSGDVSRNPLLQGRWFGTELDKIGQEQNVQVVDLFNLAQDYFVSIGQDATNNLYMANDTLHPNREGAKVLAKIMSEQIDFSISEQTTTKDYSGNTIYIAGDSTVQSYKASQAPQQGWGYYLKDDLKTNFQVENHAIAGRSSKSFFNDGRLQTILDKIKKEDYLLIQFGINDSDYTKEERYAPICNNIDNPTDGSYEFYILKYVNGALEKGAIPVLISPTLGLKSYSNGKFVASYTGHIDALQKIANKYNIPFINLNALMVDNYNSIGYDAAKLYHMCGAVEGSSDMTHFCEAGADNAANLLSTELNKVIADNDKKQDNSNQDDNKDNTDTKTGRQVEALNRGLVAMKTNDGVYLSWRLLGTESYETGFNVYRNGQKIAGPITDSTNYLDKDGKESDKYFVRTVLNGAEITESDPVTVWGNNYLDVPLNKPADVDGASYSANDATVADVDGDGEYEIILKWDPSNSKDNSQKGKTSNVYIDCYELDGTQKWRIDLGKNIRAGAHYTQFMAYDFDGDGKAELAMKTADGTVAGDGTVIGDASKDYRNDGGYILDGPEYLTLFEGETGKILDTIDYEPARGNVNSWGDKYGNRVDRFLATVAYLDGKTPSLVMCRGYYTRAVLVAYDCKNKKLTKRWKFDSNDSGNSAYAGQGNHNLASADVDEDGKDEIVYGSCVIDDDGKGLYSTGQGHGDAMHVGDFDPQHPGLEVFQVHEGSKNCQMRDAKTGQQLWLATGSADVGRGIIANIGPDFYPYITMASNGNYDSKGNKVEQNFGKFGQNFVIWWDGDLYQEGLDRNYINKYNYNTKGIDRLLTADGVHSNNGTKSTPSLSGDILGDWREEVIWPTSDDTALRIYSTTTPTEKKLYTFEHDVQYREAIAWQNVAYNQPPHPSFYVGEDMPTPTKPNVYTVGTYKEKKLDVKVEGENIAEGLYQIKNANSDVYLDVTGGKAENKTNVQQWGATGAAPYNTWRFVAVGDGYYQIYSQVGDKSYLLDLDMGNPADGTNIQIYQDTHADAQLYKFVKNTDGSYSIRTKASNDQSAITAGGNNAGAGTNICQWTYNGESGQKWILIPVEEETSSETVTAPTEEITTETTTTREETTEAITETTTERKTEEPATEPTKETTEAVTETTTENPTEEPTTEEPTSEEPTNPTWPTPPEETTSEDATSETVTEPIAETTSEEPTGEEPTNPTWPTPPVETTGEGPTSETVTEPIAETTSEEPTGEEPTTTEPTSEEPTSEEPTSERPTNPTWPTAPEEPTSEDATSERPTNPTWPTAPEEPTSEDATSETVTEPIAETTSEEPTGEEPTSERPTNPTWPTAPEETTAEEPTSERPTNPTWPTLPEETTTGEEPTSEKPTNPTWPTAPEETTTEEATTEPEVPTEEPTSEEATTEQEVPTEKPTSEETTTEPQVPTGETTTKSEVPTTSTREETTTEAVTTVPEIQGLKVDRTTANIVIGKTKTVHAIITPKSAANQKVSFISSNSKIVTVDANGVMKGRKLGRAIVRVVAPNGKTAVVKVQVRPAQVKGLKKKQVTAHSVKLTWKKQKNVTGYLIYSNVGSSKKYRYVKATKKTSIVIKNLKKNTSYRFKVRAYKDVSGRLSGACSDAVKVKTKRF